MRKVLGINILIFALCVLSIGLGLVACKTSDRKIIKSIISEKDSTVICNKKTIGGPTNDDSFQIPLLVRYIKWEKKCFFVLKNSNFKVADFKFKPSELKSAKIVQDSSFNSKGKFEYIETNIYIDSEKKEKFICVQLRNDHTVRKIAEFSGDDERNIDVFEFDEKGFLIKRYKERL